MHKIRTRIWWLW